MATRTLVAFDLGAESGRAMIGRFDGRRVALEEAHRFGNGPVRLGETMYWDLPRLFSEMKTGLRRAADLAGRLDGVGCDTWGVDFGLIDKNGALVGAPVHYRDARTNGIPELVFDRVPWPTIFAHTGIQLMQINTLYQLFALKRWHPRVVEAADCLLMISGLLTWLLSGREVEEYTNATTSQLYNPRLQGWAAPLFEALDLPLRIMPEVVAPASVVGSLRPSVAEELDLPVELPVIAPACHDTGAAVAAVPAEGDDGWAYLSSGTWSLMGVELPEPLINDATLAGNFTNEGGVRGTTRFLKNIMGLWLVQESRRRWQRDGRDYDYGTLTQMAADAGPAVALVNPNDPAFLAPADMPLAIVDFCRRSGQSIPDSPGAIVRCALESLALIYRYTLEQIQTLTGRTITRLHVVGGGCQNRLLNQLTADALGLPVVAGPVEATALGNVLCQAMALGDLDSLAELREVVRASVATETYVPTRGAAITQRYDKFLSLLR